MALRNIRKNGDEVLRKKSKIVKEINDKIKMLIEDMFETMYAANGVGLAGPQVGILKRLAVIDIGEGPLVLINPEITNEEGSQIDTEGCLSIPDEQGDVDRPFSLTVKALNENGEEFTLDADGYLARAICHETDHLNGVLFIDKIVNNNINE